MIGPYYSSFAPYPQRGKKQDGALTVPFIIHGKSRIKKLTDCQDKFWEANQEIREKFYTGNTEYII